MMMTQLIRNVPFFQEIYKNDNRGETRIKCIICYRLAHDLCAGIDDWKIFTCDLCKTVPPK